MTARPIVTTLCGSSRFPEAFALANMHLSLAGRIVIGLGCYGHADEPPGARFLTSDGDDASPEKQALDQLHFRKIDISDGIFVVNPGGYIGASTRREIEYAQALGKSVEWLFPPKTCPIPEDPRPSNCSVRLRAEGKDSPWGGCASCGDAGMMCCPYERRA